MDLNSDARARVVALFSGAAQTISIDDSGNEPDITLPKTEENVAGHLLGEGRGGLLISKRRNLFGCLKKKAAAYAFGTEKVYTFHSYRCHGLRAGYNVHSRVWIVGYQA